MASGPLGLTDDILLPDRALKAGAVVLADNAKPFTVAPFGKADRSRFLQALDAAVVKAKRG